MSEAQTGHAPSPFITSCQTSVDKTTLTVQFRDLKFVFHSQWLHDARYDDGPYRVNSIYQQPPTALVKEACVKDHGVGTTLHVTWEDGTTSPFPALWLRVLASRVAKCEGEETANRPPKPRGWQVHNLTIPEIRYEDIFPDKADPEQLLPIRAKIFDDLLDLSNSGIVKVIGLPAPDIESERDGRNAIVTRVLKQIFGRVFTHPIRGPDSAFVVASHYEQAKKGIYSLPNYDTNRVLLPHTDHSFYEYPVRVMGFYGLEGESENTFVSSYAALETLKREDPHLFQAFQRAPLVVGRVALHYGPPIYQATVDTALSVHPDVPDRFERVRWHPHLAGHLLTTFDKFHDGRRAYEKFLEITQRDTHQLKAVLKPGDLYLWDNYRTIHGRQVVSKVPRTAAGETVPEQVVLDMYRAVKVEQLKQYIDTKWLVHMTLNQLHDLYQLVKGQAMNESESQGYVPTLGC
jgi:trimethyllysine dioxygenase